MEGSLRDAGSTRWWLLPVLLPAVLVVFFAFRGGGYFAGTPAFVAAALAVASAVRLVAARRPFDGLRGVGLVVLGALALHTVWTLASALWSHAPGRAEVEYDRVLMYLLAAYLLASMPISAPQMRWALRAVAAAGVVVCGAGLVSRVLPRWLPTRPTVEYDRLGYPLTYWNALGLLAALTAALCVHLAASVREPRAIRIAAAAATPLVAVTLFFTFSRGGIAAAVVAIAAYALLARPRGLPSALLSCGPACAIALAVAYDADLLGSAAKPTGDAIGQGHHVALVTALCCAGAAAARAALMPADVRLAGVRLAASQRRAIAVAAATALALGAVAAIALGAPGKVRDGWHGFTSDKPVDTGNFRARLSRTGGNGRIEQWRVSLDEFRARPLSGSGAGTYAVLWTQHRKSTGDVYDGHSLYLETLGELGLPGLLFVLTFVVALLVAPLRRARGPDRDAYAVVFAVVLAWALHAGADWDWEMPAVTIIPVGLAALACARRPDEASRMPVPVAPVRIAAGLACLLIAVVPASMALAQGRLNDAVAAFKRGDCGKTVDSALSSTEAAGTRPEPFELLGYCDVRLGQDELGVRALETAVERDPDNWRPWYGLALVRAHAGLDARRAADTALRLNPREPLAQQTAHTMRSRGRAARRAFADRAPLPVR